MFGVATPTRPPISCTARDERVELDRAAGLGVLQHRGAKAAELARESEPFLAGLRDRAADAGADRRGLGHAAQDEVVDQLVVEDRVAQRAGQRRDRVHRHVAPELVPNLAAHVVAGLGLEAGAGERGADRARRAATRRLAGSPTISRSPTPCWTRAGRRARGSEVDDAAENALERQPREQAPAGSTLASGGSSGAAAGMNHQGTPFIAGSTTVSAPSSGAIASLAAASAGALRAMTTSSCGPSAAASSLALTRADERLARALDRDAVGANARQRLTAGERRHRRGRRAPAGPRSGRRRRRGRRPRSSWRDAPKRSETAPNRNDWARIKSPRSPRRRWLPAK